MVIVAACESAILLDMKLSTELELPPPPSDSTKAKDRELSRPLEGATGLDTKPRTKLEQSSQLAPQESAAVSEDKLPLPSDSATAKDDKLTTPSEELATIGLADLPACTSNNMQVI